MKKKTIIVGILSIFFILLLSLYIHAFEISASVEEQTYSGGASIKITSNEKMKNIKIYKKVEDAKYILFYIAKPHSNSFVYKISNSKLSMEKETELKIVAEAENGDRTTGDLKVDKVKPRVSMNPSETAKPTTTSSPIPTKPTPTSTATSSPSQSTSGNPSSTEEPSTSDSPTISSDPSTPEEPSQSQEPGKPIQIEPGVSVQKFNNMNYIIIIPDNPTENMPLIVFLHGSGEIGSINGVKNLPITSYVASKEAYNAGKFVFVAPVLNSGSWTDSSATNTVKGLIDSVISQLKINNKKVVLTGMSRGGHGTWHMANTYPNFFSAIVPMSGYTSVNVNNFKELPIWAICGDSDETEQYFKPLMTQLVNNINNTSGKNIAKLEVIHGAMHTTIQQSYKRVELFKWMLEQGQVAQGSTTEEPKQGNNDPISATPGFTKEKYKTMNYFQMIPDNPTANMPLIIFLHGDGESKSFNSVGNLPISKYVSSKEAYKAGKFIFIAPHQSNYSWTKENTVATLMELIDKVANDYKVDKNRIILTGMSRGGIGTWYIANKYPNKFAAIVPMSGYSSIDVNNFKNMPIWAISGNVGTDEKKYNSGMKELVNKVNKASGKNLAKMETINGAKHSTIQQKYKRLELFKWMLAQKKK